MFLLLVIILINLHHTALNNQNKQMNSVHISNRIMEMTNVMLNNKDAMATFNVYLYLLLMPLVKTTIEINI